MDRLHLRQKHREFIHRQNMERLSIRQNIENLSTDKHGPFKLRQKHREFKHRRTWTI